jgi:hypothetical protein
MSTVKGENAPKATAAATARRTETEMVRSGQEAHRRNRSNNPELASEQRRPPDDLQPRHGDGPRRRRQAAPSSHATTNLRQPRQDPQHSTRQERHHVRRHTAEDDDRLGPDRPHPAQIEPERADRRRLVRRAAKPRRTPLLPRQATQHRLAPPPCRLDDLHHHRARAPKCRLFRSQKCRLDVLLLPAVFDGRAPPPPPVLAAAAATGGARRR